MQTNDILEVPTGEEVLKISPNRDCGYYATLLSYNDVPHGPITQVTSWTPQQTVNPGDGCPYFQGARIEQKEGEKPKVELKCPFITALREERRDVILSMLNMKNYGHNCPARKRAQGMVA